MANSAERKRERKKERMSVVNAIIKYMHASARIARRNHADVRGGRNKERNIREGAGDRGSNRGMREM